MQNEIHRRAAQSLNYFLECEPLGALGVSRVAHGIDEDFEVPNEHLTCDLVMALWAAFELSQLENDYKEICADLAQQVCARQQKERDEYDLFGYFHTYASTRLPEKAWLHSLVGTKLGSDIGATFPHYILPLIWMYRTWPEHPDASTWQQTIRDFAYGYFDPACRANPFYLLPLGLFPGEGLLWFSGLWHGMNCVYPLAAALALEFETFFSDPNFREIAAGNIQWIAGLNSGLTKESLCASHMWTTDVPDGEAVPVSMIFGIGAQTAGNWLAVRGSICNGFSTGDQFVFDQPARQELDGPFTFTDEDWIPHAGGWLSALARL